MVIGSKNRQRVRHLPRPPLPSRNTIRVVQRPDFIAVNSRRARDSRNPADKDDQLLCSHFSDISTDYNSQSAIGDSSSLFSINTAGEPTPPPARKILPYLFDTAITPSPQKSALNSPSSSQVSPQTQFGEGERTESSPFALESSPPTIMVVERAPPKAAPRRHVSPPRSKHPDQPEFGKPSPLHNRLQPSSNIFNVPRHDHPRPEHHRPVQAPIPPLQQTRDIVNKILDPLRPQHAVQPKPDKVDEHGSHVPRPTNPPIYASYPKPQPTISAGKPTAPYNSYPRQSSAFSAVDIGAPAYPAPYAFGQQRPLIDLTQPQQPYGYDPALSDNQFGAPDPYQYVDAQKANENIKALLEGAFEDEEDKAKTRGRKKKAHVVVDGLADRLKNLDVEKEEPKTEVEPGDGDDDDDDDDDDDGSVEGLKVKLLPHQVDGVEWMREKEISAEADVTKKNRILPKGGILADDMGLGKTIQSIALMLTNPRPSHSSSTTATNKKSLSGAVGKGTLVVAPLALIKQWEAEIKDRVEESHRFRVCIHHGPQRTKRFEDLKKYDVVITTYQILVSEHGGSSERNDGPQVGCFGLYWYRVILDEAHTIKNRNAKATKAAYALKAEYRWCLTGTPMQNNLDELQSLIKFLRIKPYNEISVWKDQITRPMSQGRGGVAIKRLQYYLKAFMKRRTKDVLRKEGALNPGGKADNKDGPNSRFKITARKVETVVADFSDEERRFYDRLEKRTDQSLERMMDDKQMNYASALVLLLRLRQACNHPQLVGGQIQKDKDALKTGAILADQTPRKSKVVDQDIDEIADLFGSMTVQRKQCQTCPKQLDDEEISNKAKRCAECVTDFDQLGITKAKKSKQQSHRAFSNSRQVKPEPHQRRHARAVILDSEDEDDGEWIVPEDRRGISNLGETGGTDDEDADGGGESLRSSDTEPRDQSDIRRSGSRRKPITLDTSDEESQVNAETSQTSTSDNDGEDNDEDDLDKNTPVTSAKIRQLVKILNRETPSHKTIVFSQFTSMLDLIEPHLRDSHLTYTRYDGSMRNDAREASLERLRNKSSCRILLCSLKCGSLGLNLTAASRVVILEPFWNPFVEEQAIDRVHRLNQTKDVVVYKLTVQKTVEERILVLQEKKRALANAAIEGKENVGKLTMKDILKLFGRDAEHDTRHADIDVGVGTKTRVLNAQDMSDIRQVGFSQGSSRRVTPPVMEKSGSGWVKEDAIYGRRW